MSNLQCIILWDSDSLYLKKYMPPTFIYVLNLFHLASSGRLTKVSGLNTSFGYAGSGLSSGLSSVLTQRCEPRLRHLSKPLHWESSTHCSPIFAQPHGISEEYKLERKSAKLSLSCLMSGQSCSLQDNF